MLKKYELFGFLILILLIAGCTSQYKKPDNSKNVDDGEDIVNIEPVVCIDCAAPPAGCHYDGANCTTCGNLVGDDGGICNPLENIGDVTS